MIVFHIGMGKCGSSTIQSFLRSNESCLQGLGVDYPAIGRKPPDNKAHHNIAYEMTERRRSLLDPQLGGLSDLVRHWATLVPQTMVLSSEMFKNAEPEAILGLRESFLAVRPSEEFRILLVIRELAAFLRSRYLRMVRYGARAYDFDQFFRQNYNRGMADFHGIAEKWAAVFGWSAVEVRVLDSRHLLNGDLLDDFMALLAPGIRIGEPGAPTRTSVANISPGWKTVEALRSLYAGTSLLPEDHPLVREIAKRRAGKSIAESGRRVGDRLGWNDDKGQYLTEEQAQLCFDQYRTAIDALNQSIQRKLAPPEPLDPGQFRVSKEPPSADSIPRSELKKFYARLSARVSRMEE